MFMLFVPDHFVCLDDVSGVCVRARVHVHVEAKCQVLSGGIHLVLFYLGTRCLTGLRLTV